MAKHRCIESGKVHFNPAKYSDTELLLVLARQQESTWQELCERDRTLVPARVRRWRRMIANEVHRRGLT